MISCSYFLGANKTVEADAIAEMAQNTSIPAKTAPDATTETTADDKTSSSAMIPVDEAGNPMYEQVDADTAWDAIVEQTDGDVDMAQAVVDGMVADKEAALKKAEKAKSKGGVSIAEKIAAEKERKAAIDAAKQELAIWQKIAEVSERRKAEAVETTITAPLSTKEFDIMETQKNH